MMRYAWIALLLSLAAVASGQDWLGTEFATAPVYSDIRTYFTDPVFNPTPSHAERQAYEAKYYPYFGEDFFTEGLRPGSASQQAIETRRQATALQYAPYFGEEFLLSGNDPYSASQQAIEARRQASAQRYAPYFGERFFTSGEGSPFIYPGPYGVFPISSSYYFDPEFAFIFLPQQHSI